MQLAFIPASFLLISLAACTAQEESAATFNPEDGQGGSGGAGGADEADPCAAQLEAYAELEKELEKIQQCDDASDCGGTVPRLVPCEGMAVHPVNSASDTSGYTDLRSVALGVTCDDATLLPYLDECPFTIVSPIDCKEHRCRFIETPCGALDGDYASAETYECGQSTPCSWRLGFDRVGGDVIWDRPADGGNAPDIHSAGYRCAVDGSLELLENGNWTASGATFESPFDITWMGAGYFRIPPRRAPSSGRMIGRAIRQFDSAPRFPLLSGPP